MWEQRHLVDNESEDSPGEQLAANSCRLVEVDGYSRERLSRLIDEAVEAIEFAKRNTNGRDADRRLAKRRLQPLGHLTARGILSIKPVDSFWVRQHARKPTEFVSLTGLPSWNGDHRVQKKDEQRDHRRLDTEW